MIDASLLPNDPGELVEHIMTQSEQAFQKWLLHLEKTQEKTPDGIVFLFKVIAIRQLADEIFLAGFMAGLLRKTE